MMKYIHYGNNEFDVNLFKEIKNREMFVKPHGGLWACGKHYEYNWKSWCKNNDFYMNTMMLSFEFELKKDSNILIIDNYTQLYKLPNLFNLGDSFHLDFEALSKNYDAIELLISKDYDNLYWKMYGWDCDSILIMNKEVIIL